MKYPYMKKWINKYLYSYKSCIKNLYGFIPYKWRIPKIFWDNYNHLKYMETWSEDQIREYEYKKLKDIITHAWNHVPYYREKYNNIDFHPEDFKHLEDLKLLPSISKEDIKNNLEDFVSETVNRNDLITCHTGGSMATPLKFYSTYDRSWKEISYFYYMLEKIGYTIYKDRCVKFKGNKVVDLKKNTFHVYDRFENMLVMDSDYLNKEEYINYYISAIKSFNAKVLFGYPSSILQLAKTTLLADLDIPKFDIIWLASENIYPDQVDYFRSCFKAKRIISHYGHSEMVLLAFKDFDSENMHFIPEYGYLEVIDVNGNNIINTNNKSGELIGTNFSFSMPFIRYRTNDFAITTTERIRMFPSHYCVKEIQGRLQEFIVTRDNRLISICTMGAAHFKELENVLENQYFQDTPGEVQFRVVENPKKPLSDYHMIKIEKALEKKMQYTVNVSVKKVKKIDRLPSNKKSMIEQKLDITSYLH